MPVNLKNCKVCTGNTDDRSDYSQLKGHIETTELEKDFLALINNGLKFQREKYIETTLLRKPTLLVYKQGNSFNAVQFLDEVSF